MSSLSRTSLCFHDSPAQTSLADVDKRPKDEQAVVVMDEVYAERREQRVVEQIEDSTVYRRETGD